MKETIECFLLREWSFSSDDEDVRSMSLANSLFLPNERNNPNHHPLQQQQPHQQDRDIILFLAQMHKESKKIRPMSCAPHTICVQSGFAPL